MAGHLSLLAMGLLVVCVTALPAHDDVDYIPGLPGDSNDPSSTETPYTKPTDIPDVIPASCATRPAVNDYLMIPSPKTCTKFIVCYDTRKTEMDCPSGLFFSYRRQLCDWPGLSGCVEPTPSSDEDDTTTATPS